ncbi:Alpha/Beta hydrolase protein [Sphaerosporella brunnea]|uniref:Alpha/Beta hydrolase protein n=1 Tax=Sphaerosporella brunnea TaxID=1250544 RepID=A0A5J5EU72_9PEZI|nr:Alpha/Beta hydrolase protein [Sphaerosporella brunnea]
MQTLSSLELKSIRGNYRLKVGDFPSHPDDVLQIPSRDSGRTIKAHVYRSKANKKPSPVLINFHSSGFIIPLHGSDDEYCRYIAERTDYTVIDVSYRLAPENPFPAAPHDMEDSIKWVLNRPQEFDPSHVAISGFSAGGNLALVACATVFPKGTFRCVIAFYPPVDLAKDPGLKAAPDPSGKPIPPFVARSFNQCYIPADVDPKDHRISPCFAAPENFPNKALIITCAYDSLAPEAEALARKIQAVPGNHVVHRRMEKCDHAWNLTTKEGTPQEQAKKDAYALAADILHL